MKIRWLYAVFCALFCHGAVVAVYCCVKSDTTNTVQDTPIPLVWDRVLELPLTIVSDTTSENISHNKHEHSQEKSPPSGYSLKRAKKDDRAAEHHVESSPEEETLSNEIKGKDDMMLSNPHDQEHEKSSSISFYPDPNNPLPCYPKGLKHSVSQAFFRLFLTSRGTVERVLCLTPALSLRVENACHEAFITWRFHGHMPPFVDVPIVFQEEF